MALILANSKFLVGYIRIIGGTHRSRRIEVSDQEGLRPTTDRIREVLFNWLSPHILGAKVLDLYAGSGALGFESASREASQVTLVENNRVAINQLQNNLNTLQFKQISVRYSDAVRFCQQSGLLFDIIFLDPPFDGDELNTISAIIHQLSADDGLVYREYHKKQAINLMNNDIWRLLKQKKAGQVCFELWQKK